MFKIMILKNDGKICDPWYDDVKAIRSNSKEFINGYMAALTRKFHAKNWKYIVVDESEETKAEPKKDAKKEVKPPVVAEKKTKSKASTSGLAFPKPKDMKK